MRKLLILATTFILASCGGSSATPAASSSGGGGGASSSSSAPVAGIVEDIAIKTLPKTQYVLGEKFSIEGGVLELQYEGGGTGEVPFTDPKVTIVAPNMETLGTKTVTVDYDGFQAQYQITIANLVYRVTLDLNYENCVNPDPIEVEAGEYASRPVDPTRTDYRFLGWFIDKNGNEGFDFTLTPITADITLYASWSYELSVTFDLGDNSIPTRVLVAENEPVSFFLAPSVLREGYQFDGWFLENSRYDFATPVVSSLTLTAHWTEIPVGVTAHTFTVDYNVGEGYPAISYYVADGATTFVPDTPLIEGKEFQGWYLGKTGADTFDFTAPITEDRTVYAHYVVDFYTVNFKYVANGVETIFRSKTVNPGETVTTVAQSPRVDGYLFDGKWYSDKACTKLFDFTLPIEADYDLYTKALKRNVFEAEYTNIDENKQGVGSSDSFTGLKLIFEDNGTAGASNGYWVSGLYNNGAFIEFVIKSEKAVSDARLEMSLSSEWADIYIAPENTTVDGQPYHAFEIANYKGIVDGETENIVLDQAGYAKYDETTKVTVDYQPIALEGAITFSESAYDKRPFDVYFMTESLVLYEGFNVVRMTVRNNVSPFDGTMNAHAPMIDNMVIYTDSALSWTPKTENVADWTAINFAPNKHGM